MPSNLAYYFPLECVLLRPSCMPLTAASYFVMDKMARQREEAISLLAATIQSEATQCSVGVLR